MLCSCWCVCVRNIPFGIEENQLSKEFIKFGHIHELIIPMTEEGRQKGFAFINYKQTASAIKAVKEMNGKQLSSHKFTRTIAVDFSISKDRFINHMYSSKKIDLLNDEAMKNNTTTMISKSNNGSIDQSKDNESSDSSSSEESYEEPVSDDETELQDEESNENQNDLNDTQSIKKKGSNKFSNDDETKNENSNPKRTKWESNDIEEGKTVFIKNLSFESNQEDLTELMEQFGELEYCIICVDKVTEHSKGTAFAKFKNKEDVDECVQKSTNKDTNEELFYLDGRILDIQLAISKDKINVKKLESEKLKDKRNLYLSKEGLIYPDSPASQGVSAEDLKKRLTLSQNKKKQLENLHFFVSKNRLCFHNLPNNYKDEDLRKLCLGILKGDPDVQILFCKIMKNKDKTTNQYTTSKGFGFSTHKHALRVLRALNNNPTTFTDTRRPIVEFTIENMNALRKNKQFIIKESLELGLENEFVTHRWAGFQSKPFETQDKVINPITNKRMKDKKKKLQDRVREQKTEKREEKFNKLKKESIKLKKQRIAENRPLNKKKKQSTQDPNIDHEMKFLTKLSNQSSDEQKSTKQLFKSRQMITKKKKWDSI